MPNPVRSRLAVTSLICALFFAAAFLSLFWIIDTAAAAPLDIPLSPSLPGNLDHLNITGTKTASPQLAVNAGEVLSYTIEFSSDLALDTVTVTDIVPALTAYKSGTITGTPADSVTTVVLGNRLVWTVSDVVTDSAVTLGFAVTVTTPVSDGLKILNTAWLSDTTAVYTTTIASTPTLNLQKEVTPSVAISGTNVVYTIGYSNSGTMTATNIIITDTLPAGVSIASTSVPTSGQNSNQVWWIDPTPVLTPDGVSHAILMTATVNATGTLTNAVEIESAQGITEAATTPLTATSPSITVLKTPSSGTAHIGETITYTYRVTNTGDVSLSEVEAHDGLLGAVTLTQTTLTVGQFATATLTHTVSEGDLPGPLTNTVVVTGTPAGGGTVTDTGQASVSLTSSPAITVLKTPSSGTAHIGETITYTYRVTNTGDVSLSEVEAHDGLLGAVTLTQTTLTVGQFATATLTHTVSEGDLPGPLINTVVVTGTPAGGGTVTDTGQASVSLTSSPAITVLKTPSSGTAHIGETITYTYWVTNTGDVSLSEVEAHDDPLGTVTLTQTTLTVDEFATGTLTHTVSEIDLPGPLTNTVVVTGTPAGGGTVTDTGQASVSLTSSPSIIALKTPSSGTAHIGETITYTYRVTNTGDVSLSGVEAHDGLLGTVTLTQTTLTVDEFATGTLTHTVSESDLPGPLVNTVVVTGTPAGGGTVTDTDQASVSLTSSPSIIVLKVPNSGTAHIGETITYTYRVTNTGDVSLSAVEAHDSTLGTVTLTQTTLAVDEFATGTLTHTVSEIDLPGPLTNTVVVTGTPAGGGTVTDTGQASVSLTTSPSITVLKTPAAQTIRSGDTVTFTITVSNTGDVSLSGVTVTDTQATDCTRSIGSLATTGAYTSYTCTRIGVTADLTNTATVTGTPPVDPDVSHSDIATVDVIFPAITISKEPDQTIRKGDTATFTITVTNTGDVDLVGVTVTDARTPNCDQPIGLLASGAHTSYTCALANVTMDFTNVATATGIPSVGPEVSDTDTADVDAIGPAIAVLKTPSSSTAHVGQTITYTYRVTNIGDARLAGVEAHDNLLGSVTLTHNTLAVGEAATGTLSYTIDEDDLPGPLLNTVTVTGTPPGVGGAVTSTGKASVSLTSGPSIAVLKVPSSGTAYVGQTITYTYRVTNTGDVSLDAVESHDSRLGAVSLSQAYLVVGEFATCALGYTVVEDDLPGPLVNTVVVTGTAPGSETVSGSSTVSIQLGERQILLPVILKTEPLTYLFVTSDNTGGISRLEIWRVSDNIRVHYCENIPDNTVRHPCGAFSPGTYRVVAYTARCGTLQTQKTWDAGEVTIRVYCN